MGKKKYKDIEIGDKFERLTVIKKGKYDKHQYWLCECKCGNVEIKQYDEYNLRNGHIRSCGCLGKESRDNWNSRKHYISLYNWCIENNFEEILNLWYYDLNSKSPKDIGFKSSTNKFYFKCPRGLHESELRSLDILITSYEKYGSASYCKKCNSFGQWLMDNYGHNALNLYWDYDKNTVNPFEIAYAWNNKVWIKCQEQDYHDSYEVSANAFTTSNSRCSYCQHKHNKIHKFDSLGFLYPDVLKIWSDKNKDSPYEYSLHSNLKVYWKCEDELHNDYLKTVSGMVRDGLHCPQCSKLRKESYLQEATRTYIERKGYIVNTEWDCAIVPHSPKTGKSMPFDNEVVDLKLIIEVHGEQHYNWKCTWHRLTAKRLKITQFEAFKLRKLHDRYKKAVAECNGFSYLEIPYWTERNEKYKTLIDDKIKEIINKQTKSA